uniref:SH3 domain-containing protein n=1 Tax=Moniliophthora roreri TaxID=221103 RepID=A0A0W0GCH6_MONRR
MRATILKRAPHPAIDPSTGQAISTEPPSNNYAKEIVANTIPPSTIALAVVLAVCVLGIISGCIYWKVKKRRRSQSSGIRPYVARSPQSTLFGSEKGDVESTAGHSSITLEKPDKAFIPDPFPYEQHGGWVPQIRNYRGVPVKNGQLPGHVKAAREGRRWLKSLSRSGLSDKSLMTPPPSYIVANGGDRLSHSDTPRGPPVIPLPPTPPDFDTTPPTPPTPPASQKLGVFKPSPLSTTEPIPGSRFSVSPLPKTPGGVEPLPSPARTTSFAHQQQHSGSKSPFRSSFSTKHLSFKSAKGGLPLPRLMTVINTFEPSLDDELLIQIGETIRLLEEYNDGWCLVQRIGKADSPRGVVPRFCLVERETVIPTSSSRRNLIKSIQIAKW